MTKNDNPWSFLSKLRRKDIPYVLFYAFMTYAAINVTKFMQEDQSILITYGILVVVFYVVLNKHMSAK